LKPISVDGLKESDVSHLKEKIYSQLESELLENDTYFIS